MTNTTQTHPAYVLSALANGYRFECHCGELHRSYASATQCRKCRKYLTGPYAAPVRLTGDYATDAAQQAAVFATHKAKHAKFDAAQAARQAEFKAKVEALGLDPERYAYLAS